MKYGTKRDSLFFAATSRTDDLESALQALVKQIGYEMRQNPQICSWDLHHATEHARYVLTNKRGA